MAVAPAKTAEDIADTLKSIVDKMRDSDLPSTAAETGREVVGNVADVASDVAERAGEAARDLAGGARRTWRRGLGRSLGDVWKQRTVAIGAAGAAVPASRQLVDNAAVRLGLKQREERHWGTFFFGLLLGMAAGIAVAILTAPKPGREMREELAVKAREAGDWVPVFQRGDGGGAAESNGGATAATTAVDSSIDDASFGGGAAPVGDATIGSSVTPLDDATVGTTPAGGIAATDDAIPPILSEDATGETERTQY